MRMSQSENANISIVMQKLAVTVPLMYAPVRRYPKSRGQFFKRQHGKLECAQGTGTEVVIHTSLHILDFTKTLST